MAKSVSDLRLIVLVTAVLMIVPMLAGAAGAATVIGQIASSGARLDGVVVPSGTTLMSASRVKSGSSSVVLHLKNGQVVGLRSRSSARFESLPGGEVLLVVEEGRASVPRSSGQALQLGENSMVVLSQNGKLGGKSADGAEGLKVGDREEGRRGRSRHWDSDSDSSDSDSGWDWGWDSDSDTDTDTKKEQPPRWGDSDSSDSDSWDSDWDTDTDTDTDTDEESPIQPHHGHTG